MPRKNPIPEREREICARLRQFRLEVTRLSRVQFARLVGLDAGRLGSYEHGFAQLNYPAARAILSRFPINPSWLVTGNGEMSLPAPIDLPELEVGDRTPFSRVFRERLTPVLMVPPSGLLKGHEQANPVFEDARGRILAELKFGVILFRWLLEVPDGSIKDFMRELYQCGDKLVKEFPATDEATRERRRHDLLAAQAAMAVWWSRPPTTPIKTPKTAKQ